MCFISNCLHDHTFYFSCRPPHACACTVGKATERDLEVLLSERAAKEIYKKWIDTLQVRSVCILCMHMHACMCMYMHMYM